MPTVVLCKRVPASPRKSPVLCHPPVFLYILFAGVSRSGSSSWCESFGLFVGSVVRALRPG
eukprot:6159069-Pyramimonas_sp.AAC.1